MSSGGGWVWEVVFVVGIKGEVGGVRGGRGGVWVSDHRHVWKVQGWGN